ncbi:MAG TPA: isocitrate lyase/phosphoenolpyruvate mutase family protein [Dongiaceae bacterium]|jgi:2-methylisocitrate lyase-like PEP mutase family enzyme|nr:isocitrate lyase/phosphoenolpyruvate mutase family protein [Dongiaceae bacterium]
MIQADKARRFADLHTPGNPVVLYNIWDAGGAKAVANAGGKAIATGSWSLAAAHGYDDGEIIPLDFLLKIIGRIVESVDLPVTVDFESGYAEAPKALTNNIHRLLQTGAIGLNFEDQIIGGEGLYSPDKQAKRIEAVRDACEQAGIPAFINARTDLFLKERDPKKHAVLVDEAIARGKVYEKAGADGFFIPALTDLTSITRICEATPLPVNTMMLGALTSINDVAACGVARVSFGPGPYMQAVQAIADQFAALH